MDFIKELLIFLISKKKFILIPIVMIIVAVGSLLLVAQGSVFAPFIYTLF